MKRCPYVDKLSALIVIALNITVFFDRLMPSFDRNISDGSILSQSVWSLKYINSMLLSMLNDGMFV
jgi:hypothetical protein